MRKDLSAQSTLNNADIVVVKVGSALVRGESIDKINKDWLKSFASDIKTIKENGKKIVIVSSGGVALGRKALDIAESIPPNDIPLAKKQAASAVGQYHVFNGYFNAFAQEGITAAQVLLTMSETENRRMSLNARETLYTLLEHDIIPVINENDTVSTGEIRFGDNDRLSVRIAQMIMADAVILLSTTDGLYTDNPDKVANAELIPVIEKITEEHVTMAGDAIPGLSTGGMKSKIEAAQAATKSGISLIITDGTDNNALHDLYEKNNKKLSLFIAQKNEKNARKIWLGSHMSPKGSVIIDDGALSALQNGKSLLPIGIKTVEGDFKRGDVVEIQAEDKTKIGLGISAYKKDDAEKIIGKSSLDISKILGFTGRNELIHRNDMVLEN